MSDTSDRVMLSDAVGIIHIGTGIGRLPSETRRGLAAAYPHTPGEGESF